MPIADPGASMPSFRGNNEHPPYNLLPQLFLSPNVVEAGLNSQSTSTFPSSIPPKSRLYKSTYDSSSGLESGRPLFSNTAQTPRSLSSEGEFGYDDLGIDQSSRWNSIEGIREFLFGSKIDRKLRNPRNCREIGYGMRKVYPKVRFLGRWFLFTVFSVLVSLYHTRLGLRCGIPDENGENRPSGVSPWIFYADAFVGGMGCFVLSQGHMSMRATRERIERVRQTAITMTYSLLKTTKPNPRWGYDSKQLQLIIYECLALTVAFQVALVQQVLKNTCEPDITKYCQDAAVALQQLRKGPGMTFDSDRGAYLSEAGEIPQPVPVDRFFEIFSLHLEKEFRAQERRTTIASAAPQHIIYNIRNHFENLVDQGNLDDRRAPIVRENIDMLALAGRECAIFSYRDVSPVALLGVITVSIYIMALTLPLQQCQWMINKTRYEDRVMVPTFITVCAILGISAVGAIILTLLDELWQMWDPFAKGLNVFAWTLGVAREIDDMLNEYNEREEAAMIRKHAYLFPCDGDEEEQMNRRNFGHYFRTLTL